jgi:hypothetical protein
MSWIPATASVASNSRHASSKSFSLNGSPTCTAGPIFARLFGQFARRESRAARPSRPVSRQHRTPDCRRPLAAPARELLVPQHAETEDVDERVALEAFVEVDLAADRWAGQMQLP